MFLTELSADLPSEEAQGAAPSDDGLSLTHDRLTYSPARLLRTLQQVFSQSGVSDLAYVVIDGSPVYVDKDESDVHDLDRLLLAAREEGFLTTDFHDLFVALTHWEEGVQHVVETHVRTAVPVGEHELTITISSRPDDMNARRLDDAARYSQRLQEIVCDVDRIGGFRAAVERFTSRIDSALRRTLFGRTVESGRTVLRVVRPRMEDIASLETVEFGPRIEPPSYRILPPGKIGPLAWADPMIRVYDDPFLVFRHLTVLDAIMERQALRVEWVLVTEPDGRPLFEGHKARWFEGWPWRQRFILTYVEESGVRVQLG